MVAVHLDSELSDGTDIRNTFHLDHPTPPDFGDLLSLANALHDFEDFRIRYLAILPGDARFTRILCTQVQDPGTPSGGLVGAESPVLENGSRDLADKHVPKQACALVHLRCDVRSRRSRGHLAMPPALSSSDLTEGGQWKATGYQTAINTWIEAFSRLMPGADHPEGLDSYNLDVYSRAGRAAAEDYFFGVVGITTGSQVYWLRSRKSAP